MDNLDDKTPAQPVADDMQEQFDALRHLVVSILILVLVVSGTFTIYLLRQWRTVSKELTIFRPQATQTIAEYQKVSVPVMNDFLEKVRKYGGMHPDFVPVLAKYNIKPAGATAAPTGAAPTTVASPPAAPSKK